MILLDTCALLWLALDVKKLSSTARERIAGSGGALHVSAISAFEIGLGVRKSRLSLPRAPDAWFEGVLEHHGVRELPVTGRIAARSTLLPPLHSDPADRIIVSTAVEYGCTILTPDPLVRAYPGAQVVW